MICPHCHGRTTILDSWVDDLGEMQIYENTCPTCGGTGRVTPEEHTAFVLREAARILDGRAPELAGELRKHLDEKCPRCNGIGKILEVLEAEDGRRQSGFIPCPVCNPKK